MIYFRDVDKGYIVRKPDEGMHLEYTFKGAGGWFKTEPDSSYEREYWLGEGNTCLFNITEEEALKTISSWNEDSNTNEEAVKRMLKSETEPLKSNSNNIIEQMVDGIVGKEKENPSEREQEIRRHLSGRAWEYLMFMDDDD